MQVTKPDKMYARADLGVSVGPIGGVAENDQQRLCEERRMGWLAVPCAALDFRSKGEAPSIFEVLGTAHTNLLEFIVSVQTGNDGLDV